MPDDADQIEFLFQGNVSDLDGAFDHVDARQDAMAAKASATQKTIQQEYGITADIIKRRTTEEAKLAQQSTNVAQTISGAQRAVQQQYGISIDTIKRFNGEVELSGKAAQDALNAAQKTFGSKPATSPSLMGAGGPSWTGLREKAQQEENERAASLQRMSAALRPHIALEEQLAADRVKWAGQRAAQIELEKLAADAITRSKNSTADVTHLLATAEAKAAEATKAAGSSAETAAAQFLGLNGSTGVLSTAMSFLANPIVLVSAAIAGIVAVGAGAAFALYTMANGAGEFANELSRTNAETGLHYNNILALKTATASANVSFGTVISGVSMLEKKLGNLDTATDRVSKGLKKWGIDAQDPNKALEQIISHLAQFPEGTKRTQVAMDAFGVGGKAFAAITKEMKGSLSDYREEIVKMGVDLGGNALQSTNEFSAAQARLAIQWEVIKFKIESAATPIAEKWLRGISEWLTKNQTEIIDWGNAFVHAADVAVDALAVLLKDLKTLVDMSPVTVLIRMISSTVDASAGSAAGAAAAELRESQTSYKTYQERMNPSLPKSSSFDANLAKQFGQAGSPMNLWDRIKAISPPAGSKTPENPFGREGKKGGGGTDPAQHAIKMEQERLKQTLAGFTQEEDQWDSMLRNKQVSMEAFTSNVISIEVSRSKATMDALQKEYDAAAKLKPEAREEKRLEIYGRLLQEKYRLEKVGAERLNALDAERINRVREREQGTYALSETAARREESSVQDLADHRIISEEAAASRILEIRRNLLDSKVDLLYEELNRYKEGSSEYIRIQMQIGNMEAQRTADQEEGERRVRDAARRTLEDRIQFNNRMRGLDEELISSRIRRAGESLEHTINTGGMNNPNDQREARVALAKADENARWEAQRAEIREKARAELRDKTWQEIMVINDKYIKIQEDAEQSHIQRLKILNDARLEEMHSALVSLSGTWARNIEEAITAGFKRGAGAGARAIGASILDTIHGAAMKQLEERLLGIFDNLAGRGGIIGKIFEAITGVKKGKTPGTDPGSIAGTVIGNPNASKDNTIASVLGKAQSTAAIAQERATQQLNAARITQTRELETAIQTAAEHLCACNRVEPASFLETILQAAIGGAISGAVGGGGAGGAYEGPAQSRPTTPPVLKPGKYEGGNFGANESFQVGERGPETVYTNNRGGFVVPNNKGNSNSEDRGNTYITFVAPVLGSSSHAAPKSRREYMQLLAPAVAGALGR